MKLLLPLLFLLTLTSGAIAADRECLPSIKAVRTAHYPTVSVRWDEKRECFFAININPAKERKVVRNEKPSTPRGDTGGRQLHDSRPLPLTQGGAVQSPPFGYAAIMAQQDEATMSDWLLLMTPQDQIDEAFAVYERHVSKRELVAFADTEGW
jgi:hypothetical protein